MARFDLNRDTIADALAYLESFCKKLNTDPESCHRAMLVYEELVTNVFTHAKKGGATMLETRVQMDNGTFLINLIYDGERFDPTKAGNIDPSLPLEQRTAGGLGIFLVKQFATRFEYSRENNLNRVTVEVK